MTVKIEIDAECKEQKWLASRRQLDIQYFWIEKDQTPQRVFNNSFPSQKSLIWYHLLMAPVFLAKNLSAARGTRVLHLEH